MIQSKTLNQTVKVGKKYKMNSINEFSGVKDGIVEVKQIIKPQDMDIQTYKNTVELYKEHYKYQSNNPEVLKFINNLENDYWVNYKYVNENQNLWMPIETFEQYI